MTTQNVNGVANIVTHFNPFKYAILDYDNGFTGSTLPFVGDTLPISVVGTAPSGTPAGNKGVVIQIVGSTVTIWVWEASTSTWRSE